MIIDVSSDCGARAADLRQAGVATVFRYYSRDTIRPSKPIDQQEAEQLAAAGLRLGIVYEGRFGNKPENFDAACGKADGEFARRYAANVIRQPAGSAIYFAVDFDASSSQLSAGIVPYFRAVAEAFADANGLPQYRIGVYGSGLTCTTAHASLTGLGSSCPVPPRGWSASAVDLGAADSASAASAAPVSAATDSAAVSPAAVSPAAPRPRAPPNAPPRPPRAPPMSADIPTSDHET